MSRAFKTPNRRRIKKWKRRTERMIERAGTRGFKWFFRHILVNCAMQDSANRVGVDLAEKFKPLLEQQISHHQLHDALMRFICGSRYIPAWIEFVDPSLGKSFQESGNEQEVGDVLPT